jgi:ABC-type transporter Mla maintaining outer membrane lipid asymmetry permease subunit MlaE
VCAYIRPAGKIHWRNTKDQLQLVGPKSLGVALLTAGFVGMVFTIQVRDTHFTHCNKVLCWQCIGSLAEVSQTCKGSFI